MSQGLDDLKLDNPQLSESFCLAHPPHGEDEKRIVAKGIVLSQYRI